MAQDMLASMDSPTASQYNLNPTNFLKNAPELKVDGTRSKASLRPSPSDIPSRVEIDLVPADEDLPNECITTAKFDYRSDSEPSELFKKAGMKVYLGEFSGRIVAVQASVAGSLDNLGLRDAVSAITRAIEAAYNSIQKGERNTVRKELNNVLVQRILAQIAESQD